MSLGRKFKIESKKGNKSGYFEKQLIFVLFMLRKKLLLL